MKPTLSSNVRVFQLEKRGLLLTHQRHPKRIALFLPEQAQGEDVEKTIADLEDTIASLRSMRDRLEAEA